MSFGIDLSNWTTGIRGLPGVIAIELGLNQTTGRPFVAATL